MLFWAHATALEEVLEKNPSCPLAIIDQFAVREEMMLRALKPRAKAIKIDQHPKAESDIAVAAASVLARAEFLYWMQDKFPKGSSAPEVLECALKGVRFNGPKWLMNNCKTHFRTTDQVLEQCGFTRLDLPPEGQVTAVKNA